MHGMVLLSDPILTMNFEFSSKMRGGGCRTATNLNNERLSSKCPFLGIPGPAGSRMDNKWITVRA